MAQNEQEDRERLIKEQNVEKILYIENQLRLTNLEQNTSNIREEWVKWKTFHSQNDAPELNYKIDQVNLNFDNLKISNRFKVVGNNYERDPFIYSDFTIKKINIISQLKDKFFTIRIDTESNLVIPNKIIIKYHINPQEDEDFKVEPEVGDTYKQDWIGLTEPYKDGWSLKFYNFPRKVVNLKLIDIPDIADEKFNELPPPIPSNRTVVI